MPNLTSVHPEETTDTSHHWQTYQQFRRGLCPEEFAAAESLYSLLDDEESKHRLDLLYSCRQWAWFVRDKASNMVHVASNACRLRWCPLCSKSRSSYITHNVIPYVTSGHKFRFLTLTLRHTNAPLSDQIEKLYNDFRRLRKDRQFRKLCTGGIWFFQVKLSDKADQWHPHLHCLITGKYIDQSWLSRKWLFITKSSNIVDIRMVYKLETVAQYVARYSARPCQLKTYPIDQRVEVFTALHGRRLCGSWGTAKGVSLCPPRYIEAGQYENLGSWSMVHEMSYTSTEARMILKAWHTNEPLHGDISLRDIDNFIDNLPTFGSTECDGDIYAQSEFW